MKEPGEVGITRGEYCTPSESYEYLLDFSDEEYGSIKWHLFKKNAQ